MTDTTDTPTAPDRCKRLTPARRRWRMVAFVFVLLTAGFIAGGATAAIVIRHMVRDAMLHPERMPQRMTKRLSRRLDLTDQQQQHVLAILTARQKRLQAIRRRVQPEVLTELEQAKREIAVVLDAEQAAEWNRFYAEMLELWMPPLQPPPEPASRATSRKT